MALQIDGLLLRHEAVHAVIYGNGWGRGFYVRAETIKIRA
jgi:hypothetical protein